MTDRRLTLHNLNSMPFMDVLEACYGALKPFEAAEVESEQQRDVRIGLTMDQLADYHTFFLSAKAWFDHWATHYIDADGYGRKSEEYKDARIKRDMMDDLARACRQRYEATSRRLTQISEERRAAEAPRTRS